MARRLAWTLFLLLLVGGGRQTAQAGPDAGLARAAWPGAPTSLAELGLAVFPGASVELDTGALID